ncbi:hypothetical protein WQQ_26080 [Hydrocarboniphaga effusa AP103]|uniref:Uncharacterized protein n=1 Tax=Hydrocarboniphaga effusa AP103 TaxID=1172194 RepID=I8HZK6_9GAMM|nr:hypothetical protein WQQ_26080 [Hydrocarboniphaga effusa AP103]
MFGSYCLSDTIVIPCVSRCVSRSPGGAPGTARDYAGRL